MPLILGTNSIKDTGYDVANSVRLNQGDHAHFSKTPSTSNGTTFTYSFWVKRGRVDVNSFMLRMVAADNSEVDLLFEPSGNIRIQDYEGVSGTNKWKYVTNRLFRDSSAWFHVMYVVDTNNGTASDRVQLYINGVRETSFSTATNPSSGATSALSKGEARGIGGQVGGSSNSFDGYMAEVVYVDGTAKSTTDFGEFDEDTGIWKPIDVSDMSLGSNGWYLDFEDSSSLGNDASGSNNWTSNNLTSIDQSTDTCTNNFATMNPLDLGATTGGEFLQGNLDVHMGGTAQGVYYSTIGVSSGKWVMEVNPDSGSGGNSYIGISGNANNSRGANDLLGDLAFDYGFYQSNGTVRNNDSDSAYGSSYSNGNIIGVYLDLDNNKLYFSINGTVQNSGTGISISAVSNTPTGFYFFCVGDDNAFAERRFNVNFGNPIETISSGNTDGEFGNFEYTTTITGDGVSKTFKALCTKNLAEYG